MYVLIFRLPLLIDYIVTSIQEITYIYVRYEIVTQGYDDYRFYKHSFKNMSTKGKMKYNELLLVTIVYRRLH